MYNLTGIKDFKITNETCFVCGRKATSKEHIFPKWLQHKFDLWDQKLILPNQTKISYRQLVIPCCTKCNGDDYSKLENKISLNKESDLDIWRWANKIHFGLTLKDQIFEWDRKNPGYKIGDVVDSSDPLERSRHFLHCVSGDFKTDPDPFGSVFKFKFDKREGYNFIHLIHSSSIFISIGDRGYVIFIKDGQFLKNYPEVYAEYAELKSKKLTMTDVLFFYAKNVELIERYNIYDPVKIETGRISKIGPSKVTEISPLNKELLAETCKRFGFTWVDSDSIKG